MEDRQTSVHPLLLTADELKLQGKHLEAINICERIVCYDVTCVEAYEELGDNFLSLREYEKAEKALLYAIKLDRNSANASYLLGFLYSAINQWAKSVKLLERADAVQPNHPEILRCLGWSIFHYGQRKRGIIILERSLQLAPHDALIMCDLGVCYLNDHQFDRAIQLFSKAIDLEPENQKARECLETALFFEREYEKIHGRKGKK